MQNVFCCCFSSVFFYVKRYKMKRKIFPSLLCALLVSKLNSVSKLFSQSHNFLILVTNVRFIWAWTQLMAFLTNRTHSANFCQEKQKQVKRRKRVENTFTKYQKFSFCVSPKNTSGTTFLRDNFTNQNARLAAKTLCNWWISRDFEPLTNAVSSCQSLDKTEPAERCDFRRQGKAKHCEKKESPSGAWNTFSLES